MRYAREIDIARKELSVALLKQDARALVRASERLANLQYDSKRANAANLALASVTDVARDHWTDVSQSMHKAYFTPPTVIPPGTDKRLLLVAR